MGHYHALNAILQALHTIGHNDVVLAATPNQASSGLRRGCSNSTVENDGMALMLGPYTLSAPTLMGHYYSLNALLQALHTTRR